MRNSLIKVCSANSVYCFVYKVVLAADKLHRNSHGGMGLPPHSQVADLLPGLVSWVPREHRGEVTSDDVDDLSDHGGSQTGPWCWKLSALHLPPDKRGASGVDGHLVVDFLPIQKFVSHKITSVEESRLPSYHPPVTRST